ncbi:MAG: flagellar hook-length control protein FliK, partial [Granulosicoccaceae bacterium]
VEVAQASTAQQTEGAETTHLEIDTPVRDAQWSQALAYRVQFMAQQGIQRAQIQLNPTELGPMEITVDVVDEVAQVQITAEHAATREALEQATPRLREMMMQNGFAETGIDLSDQRNDSQELASRNPLAGDSGATSSGQSGAGAGESSSDPDKTDIGGGPEVLSGNSSPARTADGRLSFYV